MLKLVLMITIVQRKKSEEIISYFAQNNVPMTFGRYGRGTATDSMLHFLGIAEKEKCITFSILSFDLANKIGHELSRKFQDSFSFVVPISSVGGKKLMEQVNQDYQNHVEANENPVKFTEELILAIINRGYVETVMQIARDAGAPGGTVIHARGTGMGDAEKFFGVTVGAEKEMIFIVTEREKRDAIMKAVMKKAGADSPAGAILFSIPVRKID